MAVFRLAENNFPNKKSPHSILHCPEFLTDTEYMSYGELTILMNAQ